MVVMTMMLPIDVNLEGIVTDPFGHVNQAAYDFTDCGIIVLGTLVYANASCPIDIW